MAQTLVYLTFCGFPAFAPPHCTTPPGPGFLSSLFSFFTHRRLHHLTTHLRTSQCPRRRQCQCLIRRMHITSGKSSMSTLSRRMGRTVSSFKAIVVSVLQVWQRLERRGLRTWASAPGRVPVLGAHTPPVAPKPVPQAVQGRRRMSLSSIATMTMHHLPEVGAHQVRPSLCTFVFRSTQRLQEVVSSLLRLHRHNGVIHLPFLHYHGT